MRPRQFDDEKVLAVAFEQFWRKGVRATSLSDIARDAGVIRGSLYNAFGSKEALFLSAYERYSNSYLNDIEQSLSRGSLKTRLSKFFDVAIANFSRGTPPKGCPTTRGLMEIISSEDGLDETAREAFASLISQVIDLVADTLRRGAEKGEFAGDPQKTAEHIVTVARGLVVMERAFGDQGQLGRIAKHTVDAVLR
ncbi:MAG: TetR/AcrR family transcriptional regulator [Pseudomonadota bacterium]